MALFLTSRAEEIRMCGPCGEQASITEIMRRTSIRGRFARCHPKASAATPVEAGASEMRFEAARFDACAGSDRNPFAHPTADDAAALTYTAAMNTPAFPHLIKSTLGRLLEAALARVVALDPEFVAGLAALEGRRLELVLSAPPVALAATVRAGRFMIGPVAAETASDLTVRASPGALLAQLFPAPSSAAAPAGRITISGDAELARRLQQLVQRFDPDVEEAFSRVFGDVAGVQMARALKRGLDWSKRSANGFAQDAAEYLTEEDRSVVAKSELAAFHDDVDALRDDVDRFERRATRLRTRLGAD